jgi:hypothetical protein
VCRAVNSPNATSQKAALITSDQLSALVKGRGDEVGAACLDKSLAIPVLRKSARRLLGLVIPQRTRCDRPRGTPEAARAERRRGSR